MREPPARQGIQTQTTTILTVNLLREKRTVITLSCEGIQRKWPQGAPQNILLKNIEKYFKLGGQRSAAAGRRGRQSRIGEGER